MYFPFTAWQIVLKPRLAAGNRLPLGMTSALQQNFRPSCRDTVLFSFRPSHLSSTLTFALGGLGAQKCLRP